MSKPAVPPINSSGKTLLTIPRVRQLLNLLIEGERLEDAADKVGIRRHRARLIMRDPAVRRQFMREIEVLAESERARNILLRRTVRDRGLEAGATAATMKVALEAARALDGSEEGSGITINGGQNIIAGYVIRLDGPAEGPRSVGLSGTDSGKPLIEHDE